MRVAGYCIQLLNPVPDDRAELFLVRSGNEIAVWSDKREGIWAFPTVSMANEAVNTIGVDPDSVVILSFVYTQKGGAEKFILGQGLFV